MPASQSPLNQIIGATVLLLAAGIIFFPAYLYWNGSIQRSATVLPRCGQTPHFEAKDELGRSIGTAELSGTVWVVFINEGSPGDAEVFCSKFAELDQSFRGAKVVTLVSFFVGEDRNRVADYARRYEASDRWHFVPILERDSATFVQHWSSATAECRGDLRMQNVIALIDGQSQIRGVYDTSAPEVVQRILVDIGDLLRAERTAP
jgi:hypothetical protein